jgi:imidazolonepropionase-like amidohydrolase
VPECLAAARDELRKGADFLKIMCGGGVASPVDPLEMIQFTPEEIQAITSQATNLGKYVTAHAYTVEAVRHAIDNGVMGIEHGNFIDDATAKLCAEKGVFVTPTLVVYNALINPPYEEFLPESGRAKCKQVIDSGVKALTTLHENGVMLRDRFTGGNACSSESRILHQSESTACGRDIAFCDYERGEVARHGRKAGHNQ